MEKTTLHLPPEFAALASEHFRLLTSENLKKRRDTVELRLSGYSDVMHLIADLVKVSIMALDGAEGNARFNEPNANISGVLTVILDLLPYEEAELLDLIRYATMEPMAGGIEDWDFVLQSISLKAPPDLSCN